MSATITPFEIEALRCASIDTGATGFDELADKIEAMQAENAALKQRIEESARVHEWKVNGYWLELWIFGTWLHSRVSRFGDEGDPAQRMAETEARVRKAGHIRHIDTIIRLEGCDELSLHWLRLLGLLHGFWPCQQATGRRDSVKGRSITQRVVRQEP